MSSEFGKEQSNEETPDLGNQPQNVPSPSRFSTHTDENEETIITIIRATDVALPLWRLPTGFYTIVHHSGLEWRSENKRSSANDDIEWRGPIPIPSDLSATVCVEVYASFEFQPMLGAGEQLRELMITVEQLLEHDAMGIPFTLFPKDEDVVSPCSSISITVKRNGCETSNSSTSSVFGPYCSIAERRSELEDATNRGHGALLRYQRHGEKRDLQSSIEEFERALSMCPPDHSCRAAAQSNLAMVKFVFCQVEGTDLSLEVPLGLYRNALTLRPAGHIDRPFTLIQLAVVHLAQFEKRKDEVERVQAEALLREAIQLGCPERPENRVAAFLLQLTGRRQDPVQVDGQSSARRDSNPYLMVRDLEVLGFQLIHRFERFGHLADLQQAITVWKEIIRSTPSGNDRHCAGIANLGVVLLYRFNHLGELDDLEDAISRHRDAVNLTPHGHPDKPARLSNLGNSLFARFRHLGQPSDLDDAILRQRDAVDLIPHRHPHRSDCLSNLGSSFLARFELSGELCDLEDAISTLRDAVDITPPGHPHKPGYLNNLGNSFKARFELLGELRDLEDAISTLRNAVELTPHGHPEKYTRLSNLGNSFKARFERLGELSDLQDAISRYGDAVDLIPRGHPDKPGCLNNLGSALVVRFERLGELSDLEEGILNHRNAVGLIPRGHLLEPNCLNNLGNSLVARFQRLGELSDLEDAISMLEHAVTLTPHGHPDKPARLNGHGNSLITRFQHLGELSNLEEAISRHSDAVHLAPRGHLYKPTYLNNLGCSFKARFERLGELTDLEDAISCHRDAVVLTPHGHPHQPNYLDNLGNSFKARFERLGEPGDLVNAILAYKDAVRFTRHGHLDKPGRLERLGSSSWICFERFGRLSDLEDAISTFKDAIDLTPDGHPDKHGLLVILGNAFSAHFERLGDPSDVENAISAFRKAIDSIPCGHPDRPNCLDNLGRSFFTRFRRLEELSDLEAAISTLKDAIDLTPDGYPNKPDLLSNLGCFLLARFECLGKPSDLQDAISNHRDAVDLIPHDHPGKPRCLSNFGDTFLARFERFGQLSDLEDAVSIFRDAVDLVPDVGRRHPILVSRLGLSIFTRFQHLGELSDLEEAISMHRDTIHLTLHGHPQKPGFLGNLGNSLLARFRRLGEPSDLDGAISRHKDAIDITPRDHSDMSKCLNNLGSSFFARYEHFGELNDLEDAISRYRDAADHGRTPRPSALNNLGNSFMTRFHCVGELSDLEFAISRHRDAVDLTPHGHPDKPGFLNNLGSSIVTRFELLKELNDLENAISTLRDAVNITPNAHPDKSFCLTNLGDCYSTRFKNLGEPGDLEEAISLYSRAAHALTGSTSVRFRALQKWISCALRIRHQSLLDAYSVAIGLLPQLAWIGLSLTHRYQELMQGADIAREAAAAALDSGLPEVAVEWLEQGRSVVWGELFQLRSSYEQLSASHPDHAHRLRELSVALESAGATREKSLSSFSEQSRNVTNPVTESLEQEADKHRALAIGRDKLLREIRRLPGFERFLLHTEFSHLRASAHAGPVVILNAAESRCDALIVLADIDQVIHVPLPNFTLERAADLQTTLKGFLRHGREGKSAKWDGVSWETFLSPLWKCVVKPVLDALAFSTPSDLLRIFWCPTGPFTFLPIHAAGFYGTQYVPSGHKVFDFVISSYAPTLSILSLSPNSAAPNGDLRLLAVRQPPSDGLSRLPGVNIELEHIKDVIRNSPSTRTALLESSVGTVEEVLELMKEADWTHFACHGIQDAVNPTNSGLCLAGGRRLKISDIIALSRPRGGLAFLSACQTAAGDKTLSDEAIHVAAGMLFAGYGGVVGTMWSISDRLAPLVARDVYSQLFRNDARPDYKDAARALHDAIWRLRDSGSVPFDEWVPFIHVGL